MPLHQILIGIGAKLDMGSHRHKPLYTHYPVSVSVVFTNMIADSDTYFLDLKSSSATSCCSAVCLFSLASNCSPPLLVYCIFLGPRGETVALVRYHSIGESSIEHK